MDMLAKSSPILRKAAFGAPTEVVTQCFEPERKDPSP
jgi:hypothetical protein